MLDRERTEVRRNGEWLDMPMDDLFRLVRTVTLARVTERDDFSKRLAENQPISLLELLYPVLQGYDSVAVNADVELGGTDQKFNLLLGRDVQQAYGRPQQAILTTPILPGLDGERRMAKSLGNYVGVTDPPEEMFGKLMSVPDAAMGTYYELLLGEEPDPAAPPVAAEAGPGAPHRGAVSRPGRRPRRRRRSSTGCTRSTGRRRRSRRSRSRARTWTTAWSTCPPCWRTISAPPAARPAGSWPRAGCGSTGIRSRRATSTCPPTASEGAVLQVGRRKFRRILLGD